MSEKTKKRKKTVSGFGNIRMRVNNTYEGSVLINGKRQYFYGKTEKSVRKQITAAIADNDKGKYYVNTNMTVGQWLDLWKDDYLPNIKANTRARYELDIRLHLKPGLGSIPLAGLTTQHIQSYYKKELKTLSAKSVRNLHGVLHQALEQAANNYLIKDNVSDKCVLPRKEQTEMHPLTDEALKRFLKAIQGHQYENLYIVTLFTGMREGEVLGLSWDNVDFDRGIIRIRRQLQKERAPGSGYHFTTLKNGKERIVQPAPYVMEVLKRVQENQRQDQALLQDRWSNPMNLVFTTRYGKHCAFATVYNNFKVIVASIGMPEVRFHDLRHTFATLSLQNGTDIKTVSESMGHATTAFTMDRYGHVSHEMMKNSADRMQNLIDNL